LIQAVSDSLPDQQQAATRGVISNADTVEAATSQLADSLGLTRSVLKRKRGTAFANAAEATAARMLLSDSARKLADLAKQVKQGGGDAVMLQFRRQLAIHNGIQLQIKGAQTEAARLLQSFNIPVTEGMAPDAVALMNMDVIEASGGAKTLMMAADGLLKAAQMVRVRLIRRLKKASCLASGKALSIFISMDYCLAQKLSSKTLAAICCL